MPLTHSLSHSKEQRLSWEASSFTVSQEILTIYRTENIITVPKAPTTSPHPQPHQSSPSPPHNLTSWRSILILHPSTFRSSRYSCSLKFPHRNPARTSPYLPYAQSISLFLIWSTEEYLVRWTDQETPHMRSNLISYYLAPLGSRYSSQNPILEHPRPSLPVIWQSFTPGYNNRQII